MGKAKPKRKKPKAKRPAVSLDQLTVLEAHLPELDAEDTVHRYATYATEPLPVTSDAGARYSLHQTSVPIQLPDGTASKVDATLDPRGVVPLHPLLVERFSNRHHRPAVLAYLRADPLNDSALAPLLPLTLPEARELLRLRDKHASYAVEQLVFQSGISQTRLAKSLNIAQPTLAHRKARGIALLAKWAGWTFAE